MRSAYELMFQKKTDRMDRFSALCRQPKWLNLTIPGNACGLDPENYHDTSKDGYELLPHNVDCSLQQLTFLAGLACLHDLVRNNELRRV